MNKFACLILFVIAIQVSSATTITDAITGAASSAAAQIEQDGLAANTAISDHISASTIALNNAKSELSETISSVQVTISPIIDSTTAIGVQANEIKEGLTTLGGDMAASIDNAATQIEDAASNQIAQFNTIVATSQTAFSDLFTNLNTEIEAATTIETPESIDCAEQARDSALNTVQAAQESISRCILNAKESFNGLVDSTLYSINLQVNSVTDLTDAITVCVTTYQDDNNSDSGKACLIAVEINTFSAIATSSLEQHRTAFLSSSNTLRSGTQNCVDRAILNARWYSDVHFSSFQNCLA